MSWYFGYCSTTGLMLALCLPSIRPASAATQAGQPGSNFAFTVCVYGHAGLNGETLPQAKKEGTRIFRKVGVEMEWLDLDLPTSEEEAKGMTDSLEQLGPTRFVLKILPKSITGNLQIREAALDFSIPCPKVDRLVSPASCTIE